MQRRARSLVVSSVYAKSAPRALRCSMRAFCSTSDSVNCEHSLNLSLFGPPGSGKGSYGKHFAKALSLPLVTTSEVLRKLRPDLMEQMADGKLVDDRVVGETLLEGLRSLKQPGFILDGFPRTLNQVALMEESWPDSYRVETIVHLAVPDFVCQTKLLGRRACVTCGKSYNVNGVDRDGWKMPPHMPSDCNQSTCDISLQRDDDTPEIAKERLEVYHKNADPILDYICDNSRDYRLLTLTPYHGFDDLPDLVETLRRHVDASNGLATK